MHNYNYVDNLSHAPFSEVSGLCGGWKIGFSVIKTGGPAEIWILMI